MTKEKQHELQERTKRFALSIIALVRDLPKTDEGGILGRQLVKCGTSVGANYRATCRARSKVEFIARMGIVLEEADETGYWLELIRDSKMLAVERLVSLLRESEELTSIFGASRRTAQLNEATNR